MFKTCKDCCGVGCTYCNQEGLLCDTCNECVSRCKCDNNIADAFKVKLKCRRPRRPAVGDIVILPTGGPLMFISHINDNKKACVCKYMTTEGDSKDVLVPVEALRYLQPFDLGE